MDLKHLINLRQVTYFSYNYLTFWDIVGKYEYDTEQIQKFFRAFSTYCLKSL